MKTKRKMVGLALLLLLINGLSAVLGCHPSESADDHAEESVEEARLEPEQEEELTHESSVPDQDPDQEHELAKKSVEESNARGLQLTWNDDGTLQNVVLSGEVSQEDLTRLEEIDEVAGYVLITGLKTPEALEGFSNLRRIGESFFIDGNDTIEVLAGFENLEEVGGDLKVTGHERLREIAAFQNLARVGRHVLIGDNRNLRRTHSFETLARVEGDFAIEGNSRLSVCTAQKVMDHPGRRIAGESRTGGNHVSEDCIERYLHRLAAQNPPRGAFDATVLSQSWRSAQAWVFIKESQMNQYCDSADVNRVFHARAAAIGHCFERELQTNPSLSGDVELRFRIDHNGNALGFTTLPSTVNNDRVEGCIVRAVQRMRFLPSDGGACTVRKTLHFPGIVDRAICDASIIEAALAPKKRDFSACYGSLLTWYPDFHGTAISAWFLNTDGTAHQVQTHSATRQSRISTFNACINEIIRSTEFRPPPRICQAGYRLEFPALLEPR